MNAFSDYRAPAASTSEDHRNGWLREAIQDGEAYLKQQRAWPSIGPALDLILGDAREDIPADMSAVRVPRAKRNIREFVSIMANLRPTASNKTDNKDFYAQAEMFNKVDRWCWQVTKMDGVFREAFQATAVTGTGYIVHGWNPDFHQIGKGNISTDWYDATQVLLINPPKNHDLQECYAVIFKDRVPIHKVVQKYPLRAYEISADHGTARAYTQQGLEYVQQFMFQNSPLRALSGIQNDNPGRDDIFPTCDIYTAYIYDLSINTSKYSVEMGKPNTSWSYTVPYYGQEIPTGLNSPFEGLPTYRRATVDDARLYPLRRRIVATGTMILEDDSSPWWHGRVPGARIRFDDWPWEALGFPLSRDVEPIERDNNALLRGVTDSALVRMAPPMVADENLVSERLASRWNPRQPRQLYRLNLQMGDALKPVLPVNYADLPNYIETHIIKQEDRQDWLMGTRDLVAMAKAKQIPSEGTIEKILEMAGPLAQDMVMNMERAMSDLGDLRRFLNIQFRSTKQTMEILGEDGVPNEVFDFDPALLVPSHMVGEPEDRPSRFSTYERARKHASTFAYRVAPGEMSRLKSMTQKLLILNLQKQGLPIDWWTLAEMFEIPNFGAPPKGPEGEPGDTIFQRWILQQEFIAKFAQAHGGMPGQAQPKGRPSSNRQSPQLKQKDGGSRTTVTTAH